MIRPCEYAECRVFDLETFLLGLEEALENIAARVAAAEQRELLAIAAHIDKVAHL
jgi:hypothetical protein